MHRTAQRVLTVTAWIITLLLAAVLNVHFLTGMHQNKTEIAELREKLEKRLGTTQCDEIQELRKKIRHALDNTGINIHLIDGLETQIENLTKQDADHRTLLSQLVNETIDLGRRLDALHRDIRTVHKTTLNLHAWLKLVDSEYDPGLIAQLVKDVKKLTNQIYWLQKEKK